MLEEFVDLERSRGSWLKGAATGRTYLDFYTFFASAPLGFNHPRLVTPEFQNRLARAATAKPASVKPMIAGCTRKFTSRA